jgi:hypothetical protein
MAPLIFTFSGREMPAELRKVERSQLYGSVRTEVTDAQGLRCRLATLAGDGHTVIDTGGTALAYITADSQWAEKGALKPVNLQGEEVSPVGSSFKSTIDLSARATVDEFLSYSIHASYLLTGEFDEALVAELKAGTIFTFPFSWRGGLAADTAFLIAGGDGSIWLLVGKTQAIQFVGLEQQETIVAEEESEAEEEDDSMDFGMM